VVVGPAGAQTLWRLLKPKEFALEDCAFRRCLVKKPMRQHSFWSWDMSVSMSAVGFAALALAAGLWALRKVRLHSFLQTEVQRSVEVATVLAKAVP
jgi:hypothetical protein